MSDVLIAVGGYGLIGTIVAAKVMASSGTYRAEENAFFAGVAWPLILWMIAVYKLSALYKRLRGE